MSAAVETKLDQLTDLVREALGKHQAAEIARVKGQITPRPNPLAPPSAAFDEEALYERFKTRLLRDLPLTGGATLVVTPPEKLRKDFQRAEAERIVDGVRELPTLQRLILKFVEAVPGYTGQATISKRIDRANNGDFGKAVKDLASLGCVESKERVGVRSTLRERIASDLASYQASEEEIEAVYQTALYEIAKDGTDSR